MEEATVEAGRGLHYIAAESAFRVVEASHIVLPVMPLVQPSEGAKRR
jgi:hypothetical protein